MNKSIFYIFSISINILNIIFNSTTENDINCLLVILRIIISKNKNIILVCEFFVVLRKIRIQHLSQGDPPRELALTQQTGPKIYGTAFSANTTNLND